MYGEEVRVDFCARLREIHRFATIDELVEAIREDCDHATRLFEDGATACLNYELRGAIRGRGSLGAPGVVWV
jgi:hypothetical protein